MAFVYREERKLGPRNIQTGKAVGPGAYLGNENLVASKPRTSIKEPFQQMVDRDGKNMNSQAALQRATNASGLGSQKNTDPQMNRASIGQQYVPGPGQYDYAVGFDVVQKQNIQAQQLRQHGVESVGVKLIKNTSNFVSKKGRFDDRELRDKAMMPGPGQYSQDVIQLKTDHKSQAYAQKMIQVTGGLQIGMKNSNVFEQGQKITHPPSIPSHNTVFGYEENTKGQLIKQSSNQVGFTGHGKDTVGPGDYEIANSVNMVNKNVTGVVQWKRPTIKPLTQQQNQPTTSQTERPGPGDYDVTKKEQKNFSKPSSMFASKVQRAQMRQSASRLGGRSSTAMQAVGNKGIQSSPFIPGRPATTAHHLGNPLSTQQDVDIFEDDDNLDGPGPGAYYNQSKNSCFKAGKVPERLQYFGSKVERFTSRNKESDKNPLAGVGPGSYQVPNLFFQDKRRPNATASGGFTSGGARFQAQTQNDLTPGPGQYQARSIATELQTKVASKGGVFGSTQKRFIKPSVQEGMPGPGQYTAAPDNKYNAATNKKTKHLREQIKKSNSMYIQNQRSSALQAQSYIQQNEQDARRATKNHKNQIQYDNRTNTIAANVKKQQDSSNPILSVLKAKRNLQTEIGFGSKPPRQPKNHQIEEKPEDFLGPGYYEQRGGFDHNSQLQGVGKYIQAKGNTFIPTAKSCQNFLSNAPRFQHQMPARVQKKDLAPGPGHYGQAPGDEGSYNPWFKRSYNMRYAEN